MLPINVFNNKSTPEPVQISVVPPVTNSVSGTTPQVPTVPPAPIKKNKSKVLIIVGIVLVALLLIFLAVKLIIKPKTSSKEIILWGLWENQSVIEPLISSYESTHPGVNITYVEQSKEDYRERLANAIAKGESPDIFAFHNTWVPMFKSDLDALPSSVMTAADYSKNFYQIITSDLSYGNSIVGIPIGYDAITLYINQDIFDKAGKIPPTTWDEVRALSKELTIKDDKEIILQSGIALGRTENVDHWQDILALLMIQNGVNLSNPTGPNAEDALSFFTLFSSIDGVWNPTLPTSTQAFAAGKLAMYIAPSWRAFEITHLNPDLKFKTVGIPQVPKDNPNDPDITYATYWSYGVWSKSLNKTTAWDFLNFLSSSDSLQKLYQNEASIRSFGEPYPRTDMATLLTDHPIIGSIISQAGNARSWYLASRTFDGETGINTQVSNYFKDAINAVAEGGSANEALTTVSEGISQVLAQYGILVK